MKTARQWLRCMKVWGQDGNYNFPVLRREHNLYKRIEKQIDKQLKRGKTDIVVIINNKLYCLCDDVRHGQKGYRVLKYNKEYNPEFKKELWTWDEWYQFYPTITDICFSLGRKKKEYAARMAF